MSEAAAAIAQEAFGQPDGAQRRALVGLLANRGRLPALVAARAVAEGLDHQLGPRLANSLRGDGPRVLSPGDPIPIAKPRLREIVGRPSSSPASFGNRFDVLNNVRLVPGEAKDVDLILDCTEVDALAPLSYTQGQLIAIGVPNGSLSEFEYAADFDRGKFFDVRPRDSADQLRRLKRLVDEAESRGARILVLPELCAQADDASALLEHFRCRTDKLTLLVAGSFHQTKDGLRSNTCSAEVRHAERTFLHSKFSPYKWRLNEVDLEEDLSPRKPSVTVHLTSGWAVALLVCKDFLDYTAASMLAALGVHLVLVPSFTPKMDPFVGTAAWMTTIGQTIVVVANGPASVGQAAGFVSLPRTGQEFAPVPAGSAPGLAIVPLDSAGHEWVPIAYL